MASFIRGGFFANRKTQIMTYAGIVSALCSYLVGDSDVYVTIQTIVALCGVYFMHKLDNNKGK